MFNKLLTRAYWEPIARGLFLLASGAYLFSLILDHEHLATGEIRSIVMAVRICWWLCYFALLATMPKRTASAGKDPGPALSGTYVVVLCGLAAIYSMARDAAVPKDFILPALIAAATIAVAILVYRFASAHADEIGEARFDTRNRDS